MDTLKISNESGNQTIMIPEKYRIKADSLFINKIGDTITLTPIESLAMAFEQGAALLSEDFLADGVPESKDSKREVL